MFIYCVKKMSKSQLWLISVVIVYAVGERSAGGDQWRQYNRNDSQSGCGADPDRRKQDTPCVQKRKWIRP